MSVSSPPLSVITLPSGRRQRGQAGGETGRAGTRVVRGTNSRGLLGLSHLPGIQARGGCVWAGPGVPPQCASPTGVQAVPLWPQTGLGPWKGKAYLFTRLPLSSLTQGPQPRAPLPSASAPESTEALRAPEPAPSPAFWHLSRGSDWHVCSLVSVVGDFIFLARVVFYVLLRLSVDLAFSDSFILLTSGLCLPFDFRWPLGPLSRPPARPPGTLEWLCVVHRTLGITVPKRRAAAVRVPWSGVSEAKVGFLSSAWGRGVTYG